MKKYSKLRNLKRLSLEKLLPLKFPLSIYIETGNQCNFRCRYCPISRKDYAEISGGFKTMSFSDFENVCRQIKDGGRLKVLRFYFMGEPLLNPRLPEMIKMACRMKLADRTELTTNGVFLSGEKSKEIIYSGLDYLRISVSSVDKRRHEHVTQTKVPVDQIYNSIKLFREIRDKMKSKKPFIYVKMLDSLNSIENSKFLQMYGDVADEVLIEKPMNWDNYDGYDFLEATYDDGKNLPDTEKLYPHNKSVCPFPFYNLMISVNGDVTVCCVDWNKATRVGNVFEDSLKSIWDGDKLRDFRLMHILRKRNLNPSCRNCQFLYTVPDNLDDMSKSKIKAIIGTDKIKTFEKKKVMF